jgi:hypothetical protein
MHIQPQEMPQAVWHKQLVHTRLQQPLNTAWRYKLQLLQML